MNSYERSRLTTDFKVKDATGLLTIKSSNESCFTKVQLNAEGRTVVGIKNKGLSSSSRTFYLISLKGGKLFSSV